MSYDNLFCTGITNGQWFCEKRQREHEKKADIGTLSKWIKGCWMK